MHPDRLAQTNSRPMSPSYRESRPPAGPRGQQFRERSPPTRKAFSPRRRTPPVEPAAYRSPPRRGSNAFPNPSHGPRHAEKGPPSQPSSYRMSEARPAPAGPSVAPREPPSAPRPTSPSSMSAHSRPGTSSVLSAPTRPRGGYGGPPPQRGARPPAAPHAGSSRSSYDSRPPPSDHVPNAPRSAYDRPPSTFDTSRHAPPFRSNNSSSTTYPRTQRFSTTNHLASLPAIIPGGKAFPNADPASAKKIGQLEEDAEKLRKTIEEKQKVKREVLREWETRERESRREGLRSELAEAQLEGLSGEVIGGTAF